MKSLNIRYIFFCTLLIFQLKAFGKDTVRINQGILEGIKNEDGSVRMFRGIPYAVAPVGALRWQEPQPVISWKGVRDASHYGNSAMQNATPQNPWTPEFINDQPISEDCLYLNIWAPAKRTNRRFAVLVYLHGGGYTGGSGATSISDGQNLAKKGIIVVGVNYRLGVFGFFAYPELTAESPNHSSGNYGLMDQVAALKWIKKNIAAFGGDPERVTICGQSSGAGCVHDLIASSLAKGLFSGAIAESGSDLVPRSPMLTLPQAEIACVSFTESVGIHSLAQLRALTADQLLSFNKKMPGLTRPIIDGYFLPESVPAIYRKGLENDVPIITGINADEGSNKGNYGRLTAVEFKQHSQSLYAEMYPSFAKIYQTKTTDELISNQIQSMRDYGLASLFLWAKSHQMTSRSKTFIYYFDHPIPWPEFPQYGSFHCAEMPYVFNNLDRLKRPWKQADFNLAQSMSDYWINFINSGDPNSKSLPQWKSFVAGNNEIFKIGAHSSMITVLPAKKLKLFSKYFEKRLIK